MRMSEKEKVYFFCLLFPLLWPFIPVLLLLDFIEWIGRLLVKTFTKNR